MSKLNGSGNSRRIWRTLPVISSELLVPLAQQAENDGVEAERYSIEMPDAVPMITQERAYTSPIWYTP